MFLFSLMARQTSAYLVFWACSAEFALAACKCADISMKMVFTVPTGAGQVLPDAGRRIHPAQSSRTAEVIPFPLHRVGHRRGIRR